MSENQMMEPTTELSPEQHERDEEERKAYEAALFNPYRKAKQQRQTSAKIVAEHDDMLAEILFEMTMNQFGEEI